ncbi:MAG TPA: SDR family NAD(P)-dependent oxidoreductase [Vicinamibacterales bacterium]|nr:SDR family NAD(P)-dependent oxidoreductase [Vicinamibacterales bacterium]
MTSPGTGALAGRHAVVTGGSRGLGATIAEALAARGASVSILGRDRQALEAQVAVLRRHQPRAEAISCDVGDPDQISRAFAEAVSRLGPVEILVNNAGQGDARPFGDVTLAVWNQMLAVNLTGAFLCTQHVLPAMIAAGFGRVVNIASTAGLKGYTLTTPYCASKHGLVGLTRALAVETAKSGVTINAVCPGYVDDTDMLRAAVSQVMRTKGENEADARKRLARASPRGWLITRDEVADAVAWLCSPGASAITGQAIAVAAGEVM